MVSRCSWGSNRLPAREESGRSPEKSKEDIHNYRRKQYHEAIYKIYVFGCNVCIILFMLRIHNAKHSIIQTMSIIIIMFLSVFFYALFFEDEGKSHNSCMLQLV